MVKKNRFSIFVGLIIVYLSLVNSDTFDNVSISRLPDIDKAVHFLMYFGLMSVIILENRKSIKGTGKLFLIALIPFLLGVLMEILQETITISRTGNILDAVANLAGILCSLLLWTWIKPLLNRSIRS